MLSSHTRKDQDYSSSALHLSIHICVFCTSSGIWVASNAFISHKKRPGLLIICFASFHSHLRFLHFIWDMGGIKCFHLTQEKTRITHHLLCIFPFTFAFSALHLGYGWHQMLSSHTRKDQDYSSSALHLSIHIC